MSKLGAQYQSPVELGAESTEIVRNSKIEYVKLIDPDRSANCFPDKTVIGRYWIGGDGKEMEYVRRGAEGAAEYFAMLFPRYKNVDIIEGPNETQVWCCSWKAASDFQIKLAELVHSIGKEYAAWSFSVFWPKIIDVARLQPSLAVADYLELHDYWVPYSPFTGHPQAVIDELNRLGIHTKVIIGECGVDGGIINHPDRRGWKDFDAWGYDRDKYWADLSKYDDLLPEEVVAVTPFVTNPYKTWQDFDIDGKFLLQFAKKWEESVDVESAIISETQKYIVPLNPAAAFEQHMSPLLPASKEFDILINGIMYRAQAYRDQERRESQFIAYAEINDWANIKVIVIANQEDYDV